MPDHMYVELAPGVGQWIVDAAEKCGCDLGPILGVLLSEGLWQVALRQHDVPLSDLATRQFLYSVKLAGGLEAVRDTLLQSSFPF